MFKISGKIKDQHKHASCGESSINIYTKARYFLGSVEAAVNVCSTKYRSLTGMIWFILQFGIYFFRQIAWLMCALPIVSVPVSYIQAYPLDSHQQNTLWVLVCHSIVGEGHRLGIPLE